MYKSYWIAALYGLVLLVGGWIGHSKAGSTASLAMGVTFGLAFCGVAWILARGLRWGLYLGIALGFILFGFFVYRYAIGGRFMPPGFLALCSFATCTALVCDLSKRRRV